MTGIFGGDHRGGGGESGIPPAETATGAAAAAAAAAAARAACVAVDDPRRPPPLELPPSRMSKLRYPLGATADALLAPAVPDAPAVPAPGLLATEANAGTPATTVSPPRGGARVDGPRNEDDAVGLDGARECGDGPAGAGAKLVRYRVVRTL